MSNEALTMMLITEITISAITFFFFWKVVKTPPKPEPDSYTQNDDVLR